jgi:lipoprotein-releasing system permease protein
MLVMIISIATGIGLQKRIGEKITEFTGDLQVVPYMESENGGGFLANADSIVDILQDNALVTHSQKVSEKGGLLKTAEDFEGVTVKAVGGNYNWAIIKQYLVEGSTPVYRDSVYNDSILISVSLKDRLELETGQEVVVFFLRQPPKPPLMRRFIVSGSFATGMEEFDGSYVIAHDKHILKINKWETGSAGKVEVSLGHDLNEEEYVRLRNQLPLNADLLTAREAYLDIFQWIDLFDVNIYLILIVMIAVGLVNSVIALLTIILEKRRTIGLLKSLGATESQLRKLFRLRSLHIIGRGMLWGNILGIGLCLLQSYAGIISLDPEIYYVDKVPIHLEVWHIIALNAGVILFSYLAMNIPVSVISRMRPVDSLKSF